MGTGFRSRDRLTRASTAPPRKTPFLLPGHREPWKPSWWDAETSVALTLPRIQALEGGSPSLLAAEMPLLHFQTRFSQTGGPGRQTVCLEAPRNEGTDGAAAGARAPGGGAGGGARFREH